MRLTKVVAGDEAILRPLYRDTDVMRFYPAERTLDLAPIFVARTLSMYELRGYGLWNVHLLADETFVGQCGFVPADVEGCKQCEVMIFLHRQFWRDGYAEEVLRATTSFGLRQLGLCEVIGLIYRQNRPSTLLARRGGFSFARTVSMPEGPMDLYRCMQQPLGLYETDLELHVRHLPPKFPSYGTLSIIRHDSQL